ncbi:hypothetical protein NA57DRAFT_77255 [Rhizodiscina lignyota]|uniref:G-protein coupled receptors family 2 profile 2 domain-containing protein n=1 Tax=Rhizodiscina lignyota TaxID=1504668 RepID=A0A9P4IAB4_9PEZI|nr:hypothetical protein NA57DRAFT_77255 [Rhizodiscina lignyota]
MTSTAHPSTFEALLGAAAEGVLKASNGTSSCPPPFLSTADFPPTGGYIPGRFCGANPLAPGTSCCLPCPVQYWVYSDKLLDHLEIPGWISVASLVLCAFLLLTWIVLPPERSHRHYLSIGLIVCLILVQLAFIIPLGTKPPMCYDEITPQDMHTSMSCAWTGALFQAGGLGAAIWIVLRTLWLHIRICWDRHPGKYFLYLSLTTGILVPVIFLIAATLVSGYSFRLGSTCVINHDNSFAVFWGWLLGFAGLAFVTQCVTAAYCFWTYLRSLGQQHRQHISKGSGTNTTQSGTADGTATETGMSLAERNRAHVNYSRLRVRKLRQLFFLQWRGFAISILVVLESVFFVTVFWSQDKRFQDVSVHPELQPAVQEWSLCLAVNEGDKNKCLELVSGFVLSPTTVLASYVMASLVGIEVFFVIVRKSMILTWYDLLYRRPKEYLRRRRRRASLSLTNLDPKQNVQSNAQNFDIRRAFLPGLDDDKFDAAFGDDLREEKKHHRFYAGGWAHLHRDASKRESGTRWSRTKSMMSPAAEDETLSIPIIDGEIRGGEGGPRLPPAARTARGASRILVRDPANRSSGLRLETEDEALRRLRGMDRESTVLGDDSWTNATHVAGADRDEAGRDGDRDFKGKGKAERSSSFELRENWMGGIEDDERSEASDTLGQPGPSGEQKTAVMNPLRMNPLSMVGLPKEERRSGLSAEHKAEEVLESPRESESASIQEITKERNQDARGHPSTGDGKSTGHEGGGGYHAL